MSAFIDLSGQRFGRFTVASQAGFNKWRNALWTCRCDCGTEVVVAAGSLRAARAQNQTRSCGCLLSDVTTERNFKHGLATKQTRKGSGYHSWLAMLRRCYDPNHKAYKWYGGRGITVCGEWRTDFLRFLADVGPRPDGWTLDRINNDIGYEPGNCRWAPWSVQGTNKRHLLNTQAVEAIG